MNPNSDTHPDMLLKQIELLRQAGMLRRSTIMLTMTDDIIRLSRRAIQQLHPDWSELEVKLFWAEVHYGKNLADRVRKYLSDRMQQ